MKFKILAGIFVVALSLIVIKANAQMHQHQPAMGGVVVMFGSSDHIEAVKTETELKLQLSDANRKMLKMSDFEFVKAILVQGKKELSLSPKPTQAESSELVFILPKGDHSSSGLKFTLKRKSGNTSVFTQALPFAKVPQAKNNSK